MGNQRTDNAQNKGFTLLPWSGAILALVFGLKALNSLPQKDLPLNAHRMVEIQQNIGKTVTETYRAFPFLSIAADYILKKAEPRWASRMPILPAIPKKLLPMKVKD